MDSELKENLFAAGDAKLCGGMHSILSGIVSKVSEILPVLEAIRPGSKSGIQALCALHVTLDKAKNILQHCSSESKFYLAVTGASMVLKFERVKYALLESLRSVKEIVPQVVACQILVIVGELKEATFTLDQSEKEAGDELIKLIQRENKCNGDKNEREKLEIFYQAAVKLGITSSVAALTERRALKKLVEEARVEQDEEKESTAAYVLHLMRNFSNSFVNEMSGGIDFQGSAPCTPTSKGNFSPRGNIYPLEEKLSRHCSLPSKPTETKPGNTPVPPEEFRCPISLQLMYDPVIISSGHTYERFFIEKWFNDGHNTCPKTQQQLCHLSLTPNYCVKGLIATWCEQYGLPFPAGLPGSPDGSDDDRALSENDVSVSEFTCPCEVDMALSENDVRASECSCPCEVKDVEAVLLEDRGHDNHKETIDCICSEDYKVDRFERLGELINLLNDGKSIREQQVVVERIRFLLKDNNEARIYMGTNGLTEALLRFLRPAIQDKDKEAQEMGAMALFNLAVNNNRNKETMMLAGVIPLLEDMSSNSSNEAAAALYFNLSCLDDAKPVIGSSKAVPFLIQLLHAGDDKSQCKGDALHTLYNLSTHPPIIPHLLSAGIVDALHFLITAQAVEGPSFEKPLAILINLASIQPGRSEIMSCPGMLSAIAALLDIGSLSEQEQAASCLLILCDGNQECSHMVLQEGVIPLLVLCSINGTAKCKEKAQKLLSLFRGQRQRDPSPSRSQQQLLETSPFFQATMEMKQPSIRKAASKRLGRTITAMLKNKYSLRQG